MTSTEDIKSYWKTLHGTHRHNDFYCANKHRAIMSGDCFEVSVEEATALIPCAECNAAELVAFVAPEAKTLCPNSGVKNSQRIYSTCIDCGKEGKVNRNTGRIRKHEAK